ncbi:MAG: DUF5615 family PIN-like protein [Acidobacteriaceae bacterium]
MKLLLDENLSPRLISSLQVAFPGSDHVHNCHLGAASDSAIWDYAKTHGFAIVSKDSDFAERAVLHQIPPKVIWIHLGNCSTDEIYRLLHSSIPIIRRFIETDEETCLILTQIKTPSSAAP